MSADPIIGEHHTVPMPLSVKNWIVTARERVETTPSSFAASLNPSLEVHVYSYKWSYKL